MEDYINKWKDIQMKIIDFLENECYTNEDFHIFPILLDDQIIKHNRVEFEELLHLISIISKNHHRYLHFNQKIKQIINHLSSIIKQTFSNLETYKLFKNNKQILRYLLDNQTIVADEQICSLLIQKYDDLHYFLSENENEEINDKEKRENGENESYLCTLIRSDSVQEFISYVNRMNLSLPNTIIKPSIYETNSFLLKKEPSLIEYAAFFGSIQIFRYLEMNQVELKPSLWLYAIHSKNEELIHLLEENHVEPNDKTFLECFLESIKCHHNDIANYIQTNLLDQNIDKMKLVDKFNSTVCRYHNFKYFQNNNKIFFYLIYYNYSNLVDLYLKERMNYLEERTILKPIYFVL